jgi:hypothetical protein
MSSCGDVFTPSQEYFEGIESPSSKAGDVTFIATTSVWVDVVGAETAVDAAVEFDPSVDDEQAAAASMSTIAGTTERFTQ